MRIAIFGGTGFVGKRIAEKAAISGHKAFALGSKDVDIFDPTTYEHILKESDAVIHSIGTFFPSSTYKKLVGQPLSPCSMVELVKARVQGGNPMTDGYTKLNTSSAEILARATASIAPSGTPFIYISAESSPLTNAEYIESKRRAEQLIADNRSLRSVFMRPGIIYDHTEQHTFPPSPRDIVSTGLGVWESIKGDAPRTSVHTLAMACVDACTDDAIAGVVPNSALKQFELMARAQLERSPRTNL